MTWEALFPQCLFGVSQPDLSNPKEPGVAGKSRNPWRWL